MTCFSTIVNFHTSVHWRHMNYTPNISQCFLLGSFWSLSWFIMIYKAHSPITVTTAGMEALLNICPCSPSLNILPQNLAIAFKPSHESTYWVQGSLFHTVSTLYRRTAIRNYTIWSMDYPLLSRCSCRTTSKSTLSKEHRVTNSFPYI